MKISLVETNNNYVRPYIEGITFNPQDLGFKKYRAITAFFRRVLALIGLCAKVLKIEQKDSKIIYIDSKDFEHWLNRHSIEPFNRQRKSDETDDQYVERCIQRVVEKAQSKIDSLPELVKTMELKQNEILKALNSQVAQKNKILEKLETLPSQEKVDLIMKKLETLAPQEKIDKIKQTVDALAANLKHIEDEIIDFKEAFQLERLPKKQPEVVVSRPVATIKDKFPPNV